VQQRARRMGLHALRAANFAAHKDTPAATNGHVVICDASGNQLAGPFDLDTADVWLTGAAFARLQGRPVRSTWMPPTAGTEQRSPGLHERQTFGGERSPVEQTRDKGFLAAVDRLQGRSTGGAS
jgi:hypothetical protein